MRGDVAERERHRARAVTIARALRLGRCLAQAERLVDRGAAAESA